MNSSPGAYLAICIGIALISYVCFVVYKTFREKQSTNKEKNKALNTEGAKFFTRICKPFVHKVQPNEQLPNRFATLTIDGDFLSLRLTRHVFVRVPKGPKKAVPKETDLVHAWYHPNHVKMYVYEEEKGSCVAKTDCSHESFESSLRHFLRRENVIEPFVPVVKKH